MYVEGFVTLTPESGAVLSLPYMGFYGDWTEAPVVDATDYPAVVDDGDNWAQAYVNTAGVSSLEGTINTYLGDNPYHPGEVEYLADRNAISPNGDDYLDTLSFVYTGLLRNARTVTYTITDAADSSTVYYTKTVDYEIKSVYSSNYYQIIPCGVESYNKFDPWDGSYRGIKLKNDDKAVVTIECTLPCSEHEVKNDRLSWSFPTPSSWRSQRAKNITVTEEDGKYYVDPDGDGQPVRLQRDHHQQRRKQGVGQLRRRGDHPRRGDGAPVRRHRLRREPQDRGQRLRLQP